MVKIIYTQGVYVSLDAYDVPRRHEYPFWVTAAQWADYLAYEAG